MEEIVPLDFSKIKWPAAGCDTWELWDFIVFMGLCGQTESPEYKAWWDERSAKREAK